MNLLVDLGNSSLKYVFENNGQLSDIYRVTNSEVNTQYYQTHWHKVKKIIIASVATPRLTNEIITWAHNHHKAIHQVTTPKTEFGVCVGYQNHQQLGVDRWLAILAAAKTYPQEHCLIIDLGTATTVDVLQANGEHLGGWIFPGLHTMQQSLLTNTANIHINDHYKPTMAFANNTSDNVINGCLVATLGAIKIAIDQALIKVTRLDKIILTGGNAQEIAINLNNINVSPSKIIITPTLVFQGLQNYLA